MARLPRYVLPGVPQHVIQRGNNRSPTLFADEDYRFYLQCLKEATERHASAVHAFKSTIEATLQRRASLLPRGGVRKRPQL